MATDKILPGYEQSIGAKLQVIVDHYGPSSYSQTTGDVYPASNLQRGGFDKVAGGLTLDGVYDVKAGYPTGTSAGAGVTSVVLTWNFATTGSVASLAIAGAGTGQTPGTYTVNATGGGGSGAQASIVVAGGGTVTATPVILNPGKGYTSAPTFTLAAGGTPATFTPTLSTAGSQVAAGANLSGSAVRLECILY
jgi:hypothetical protein